MRRMTRSLLVRLVTILAGCLLPLSTASAVVFETIRDAQFVGRGPGPDFFLIRAKLAGTLPAVSRVVGILKMALRALHHEALHSWFCNLKTELK